MKKSRPVIFEARYNAAIPVALQEFLKEKARLSGRGLRKYFFKGLIELNGKKGHSAAKVKPGDRVRVYQLAEDSSSLIPEAVPIQIVFENDDLIVINKPALVPVHPSGSITSGTLANHVAYYFRQKGYASKVRPVNRLDYGTSGLVIFAKSARSQTELSRAIQNHAISRIYYAIVQGVPKESEGLIDYPISQHNDTRKVSSNGRPAITRFRVIESFSGSSLLELSLLTGRTHQIRIHLSQIYCPIIGDKQYGICSPYIKRPALHAGKLIFQNPRFNVPELSAALPEDFLRLLTILKQAENKLEPSTNKESIKKMAKSTF